MSVTYAVPPDGEFRREQDPLGEVVLPASRLFGPQTQRAIDNFPISGTPIASIPSLIRAIAQVKKAAAIANRQARRLDDDVATLIEQACDEIIAGQWHEHFAVDVFQGGAGTSTNMNANEVIANRALELGGGSRGQYDRISPNDHVNQSQSTNDAYATAVRLAVHDLNLQLVAALGRLSESFAAKAVEFADIRKLGRTQLQDAVPITLGQEFGAYAITIEEDVRRAEEIGKLFLEINLGGTAIGTGAGASEAYCAAVIEALRDVTGLPVERAANLIEATWDMGAFVLYSGLLKRIAAKISKIANDLRLLSSGPRGGIGDIRLPERQPGSSLMPGKVNPVIPEAMNQVAFRVFGLDTSITFAAEGGQLQLNAFEPLILWSLHEAVTLIVAGGDMLATRCIDGITAHEENCRRNLEASTAYATELVPHIGYERASRIARFALKDGGSLAEAAAEIDWEAAQILKRIQVN